MSCKNYTFEPIIYQSSYNRKFDMIMRIFLKVDGIKKVYRSFSFPTVPIKA
jgi:hypothetical protein